MLRKNGKETEWDRTIKEAIDQAKRELTQQKEEEDTNGGSEPKKQQPPKKEEDEHTESDFITTLGNVMIELPKQLEGFFHDGLGEGIYSEKIKFLEQQHSGMHISGKHQYLGIARVLKIALNAYFAHPTFTIVHMRQIPISKYSINNSEGEEDENDLPRGWQGPHSDEEPTKSSGDLEQKHYEIYIRWVFEGLPRHANLLGSEHMSRYEGEFRYKIDPKSGLISVHEVTAIHPAPPTSVFAGAGLARWAGWFAPRGSLAAD
ncbi:hypothetical protein GGI12_002377 [Dipsacomyces acuminosporus]|nr:hypothetical protein GGI12_002377 [Dipsacomyces acuminosporus]